MSRNGLSRAGRVGRVVPAFAAALTVAGAIFLIVLRVMQLGMEAGSGKPWHMIDFDASLVVGRMVLNGAAGAAYDVTRLQAEILSMTGVKAFLPWAYPPPYDLLAAGLALVPPPVAFAAFMSVTLLAYLWVMRAIAGLESATAIMVVAPVIVGNSITGQNAFLTGALAGAAALFWSRGRPGPAGGALGLLVLKPHLGLGLGALALVRGGWRMLGVAVAVALLACLLATVCLGPAIWPAFLQGMRDAGHYMATARYPFGRFVSLYAALRTIAGLSHGAALAGQAVAALVALGIATWAARALPAREAAGLVLVASLAVSPYVYDYDLALLGPAAALLIPAVRARCGLRVQLALLVAVWLAAAPAWIKIPIAPQAELAGLHVGLRYAAYAGLPLWAVLIALVAILRRPVAVWAEDPQAETGAMPSA